MKPEFLEQLSRIVGAENVLSDQQTREMYARSTAPAGTEPDAVVKPGDRMQVQSVVRLASGAGVPIYPISRGKNWGYSDACAPHPGNLIIDFSRMNHIIEVNAELAYAVIEPGVTQGQLADYIQEHDLPLMLDATGAGRDASIVGNVLERGSGHTPYGDHYATSCDYEVVLPDGSVIESGFGAYPGSQAKHLTKWGIGPLVDGLFSQSNLGIVTRMTIWLMPVPETLCMVLVMLKDAGSIGPFFETIRRLRLAGTLKSTLHCFNDRRLLSSATRYPWDKADGKKALEVEAPDLFRAMCRGYGIPAWAATGSLQGTKAEVVAARGLVRRALRSTPGVSRVVMLQERAYAFIQFSGPWLRRIAPGSITVRRIDQLKLGRDLLRGFPSDESLKGSHWRSRSTPQAGSLNPLDTGSGLIWVSPILPMTGSAVREVSELSEKIFHNYGFEYQATVTAIADRALMAVQSISFDKTNPEETERAAQCRDELLEQLLNRGYVPYRGTLPIMQRVWQRAPMYWRVVSALKSALDPRQIVAPDRYIPAINADIQI